MVFKYLLYIIIGIVVIYLIVKKIFPNKSNISIFTIISLLSQIILISGFFIDRLQRDRENKEKIIQNYVQQSEKIWIDVEKLFLENENKNNNQLNELYYSMFTDNNNKTVDITDIQYYNDLFNSLDKQTIHISSIIMQNIENLLLNINNINIIENDVQNTNQDITWLRILRNWLTSEILISVWLKYKNMFLPETNESIILLINNNKINKSSVNSINKILNNNYL
jgi:hypothetical protein